MSGGYASRLKEYPHKGICGLPEQFDTKRALSVKCKTLAAMMAASQHTVVLTGAGISTASGIPDFRGPHGIWTLEKKQAQEEKKNKKIQEKNGLVTVGDGNDEDASHEPSFLPRKRQRSSEKDVGMDFTAARPSLTHCAITKLVSLGLVNYCITQNVDGLHKRSGLSRRHHAVLHGCVFTETCRDCGLEHYRDFDVGGMSFQPTGRSCDDCCGDLLDTLLDWEDPLPENDIDRSTEECEKADLVLCVGTSLRIEPAGSLPTLAKKFVIINLQQTPYDEKAALIIRGRADDVMSDLMGRLGFPDWEHDDAPPIERRWKAGRLDSTEVDRADTDTP